MFTGIVTKIGKVRSIHLTDNKTTRLLVDVDSYLNELIIGSSHSINGVCLTLINDSLPLSFELSEETINTTNLAQLNKGDIVNLEPAMRLGEYLNGHFVTGHVDAVGEVLALLKTGNKSVEMEIGFPDSLGKYIATKGSICVDGISLTVNRVNRNSFSVTIISHTLTNTRICIYELATKVNLEVDLLARYLDRIIGERIR